MMKYRIVPILVTVFVVLLGFLVKKSKIKQLTNRIVFTANFHHTFIDLVNYFSEHHSFNTPAYDKYMHDVDTIHLELGRDGMVWMNDKLTGITSSTYQPLENLTEEMRNEAALLSNYLTDIRLNNLYGICDDILRRHIGNLDRMVSEEKKQLYNPIVCFGEGIRNIIRLPVKILVWLGLVSDNREASFVGSIFFKVFDGFVTIIGFVSSIFTIVLGWDEFGELMRVIISRL